MIRIKRADLPDSYNERILDQPKHSKIVQTRSLRISKEHFRGVFDVAVDVRKQLKRIVTKQSECRFQRLPSEMQRYD